MYIIPCYISILIYRYPTQHFEPYTQRIAIVDGKEMVRARILIVDGHVSHIKSYAFMSFGDEYPRDISAIKKYPIRWNSIISGSRSQLAHSSGDFLDISPSHLSPPVYVC